MNYPSNPSRQQFELIRLDLEAARQSTRPRKYDLYDLFCAVVYVLKTGCQWRQLPADFPNWQAVYYYYRVWSEEQIIDEPSILDKCLKKLSLPYGKSNHARLKHLS
ncbi:transposase (plasmid) [Levilactobacillus brevis]|nr:transposase [Levilactobacillus brevis]QCZ44898.1 transposase [Levilactobacillus brevis]